MRPPASILRLLVAITVAALFTACPEKKAPAVPDAGPKIVDAGPPPLTVTVSGQIPDGGVVDLPLGLETPPTVPRLSGLEVQTNIALVRYRIRVFDEADRVMVSDDTGEDGPDGTRYRIAFPTPLLAGHGYTLAIEAQTGPTLTDALGRTHPDLRARFEIEASEEPEPKPAPPKKKPRRRRR